MEPSRFRRLESLFQRALECESGERERLIETGCAGDPDLATELRELLVHHECGAAESILEAGRALRAQVASFDTEEPLPDRVGRFQVIGEIGQGGFGRVLRAIDPQIGRPVALKVLRKSHASDRVAWQRLIEEGRLGGRLQHPSIVPVHEIGTADDGSPFLAMKVVEGEVLAALLSVRAQPGDGLDRHVSIFEQVCQAIACAHDAGLVHRDLKPQNVMVGAFGEVQVMDWGLACSIASTASNTTTTASTVSGTPAYMAPEQARGEQDRIDARTDVFGLGCMLCEILTGSPPYGEGTASVILARARANDLEPAVLRLRECTTDPELATLAARCLRPAPEQRPADASELADAVAELRASRRERLRYAELEASTASERARGERKARRLLLALALVVIASTIGWVLVDRAARTRAHLAEQRLDGARLDAERLAAAAAAGAGKDLGAWQSALLAATRAHDLVDADVSDELATPVTALLHRVEARTADLEFLTRVRETNSTSAELDRFDRRPVARAVRELFEARIGGTILEVGTETAAERLASIEDRDDLIVQLDGWGRIEHDIDRDSPRPARIRAVADRLDSDSWRIEVRHAVAQRDLPRMRELANSKEAGAAAPDTTRLLALGLLEREDVDAGREVLERTVDRNPSHFMAALDLATIMIDSNDSTLRERAGGLTQACLAIEPDNLAALDMRVLCERDSGRLDLAMVHADRNLERAPASAALHYTRGICRLAARDAKGALEDLDYALARVEPNHVAYCAVACPMAAALALSGEDDKAIDLLIAAVESPRTLPEAWTLPAEIPSLPALIAAARRRIAATPSAGWAPDWVLAQLLEREGVLDEALAIYERLDGAPARIAPQSARRALELRAQLGDDAATYGSIDRSLQRLPAELDPAAARARLKPSLDRLHETHRDGLAAYLEGLLLERERRLPDAEAMYRHAIELDRDAVEAWQRLHRCILVRAGRTAADTAIGSLLAAGPLPAPQLRIAPPTPSPQLLPPPPEVLLRVGFSAWRPLDPRIEDAATGLAFFEREAPPTSEPVLGLLEPRHVDHIDIPRGALVAGVHLVLRMRTQFGSGRELSDWSDAIDVDVPADRSIPLPIDLSGRFELDVVADPDDRDDDAFDAKNSYRLVVDGYDGQRTDVESVHGLPRDGKVGVFRLGRYDEPQSIPIDATRHAPVEVAIPSAHYAAVRVLCASANGNAAVICSLQYQDGPGSPFILYVPDWFNGSLPDHLAAGRIGFPILRKMDRMAADGLEDRNGAMLFDQLIKADPARVLRGIAFLRTNSDDSSVVAHILAITAMRDDG